MTDAQDFPDTAVAVVGMALRVPGATTLERFWENLIGGVESIRTFTVEELVDDGAAEHVVARPGYVRALGALDDVKGFDARLFGISPREAQLMDPQQRIFLECVWEALERAGCPTEDDGSSIGVFGGVGASAYYIEHVLAHPELVESVGAMTASLANGKDFVATRVSYRLGLTGPSMTMQTACSTSLVAVHMAAQALVNGECDVAVAGGARIFPNQHGYQYEPGSILSPDGHCRPFDASAAGTVPGSGAGAVALKRLSDALAAGDPIEAVLLGSAVNNDGDRKVGFTAPSVEGQADVIAEALELAGCKPASIGYVEAHGTGTALGDPIEVAALRRVFGGGSAEDRCVLGSVKSNLGHLDVAAGVVSLVKVVLMMRARQLPPSLHFVQANPQLGLEHTPFEVNGSVRPWVGDRLRAGVSSFGIGGTNAHVVLEEAPAPKPTAPVSSRPHALVLSAATESALATVSGQIAAYLRQNPERRIADVAHTLQHGRRVLPYRRSLVASTVEEAAAALTDAAIGRDVHQSSRNREVMLLLPGQGTQTVDMGLRLYREEATFRCEIDRCAELLAPHLGEDLRDVLYPVRERRDWAASALDQTRLTQPALFAVEHALAALWRSWGVRPVAMLGHSIGELVAASLAGVMSPEDALYLVAERGRLMQNCEPGTMLAVSMSADDLLDFLDQESLAADVAAVNGPRQCILAGAGPVVTMAQELLATRGVQSGALRTSHAFHSRLMDDAAVALERRIAQMRLSVPDIPFVSNVTGTWITGEEATDPAYWARQLRSTVRFSDGLDLVRATGAVLLECGPGAVLSRLALAGPARAEAVASWPSAHDRRDAYADAVAAAGSLWGHGVPVDWDAVGGIGRRIVELPTYPFEHEPHWLPAATGCAQSDRNGPPVLVRGLRRVPGPAASAVDEDIWVVAQPHGAEWAVADALRLMVRDVRTAADHEQLDSVLAGLQAPTRVAGVVLVAPDDVAEAVATRLEERLRELGQEPRVVVVQSGSLDVTGEDELVPTRCRWLPWAESDPGARFVVDVRLESSPAASWRLASAVITGMGRPIVALRGTHLFIPTLDPVESVSPGQPARVVVLDAGGSLDDARALLDRTAEVEPDGPVEVHLKVPDAAAAAAAAVLEAEVALRARGNRSPWRSVRWPVGDEPVPARDAVRAVTVLCGSCQLVVAEHSAHNPSTSDAAGAARRPAEFTSPDAPIVGPVSVYEDDVEASVAALFTDLLGVRHPGAGDGFFELGGDSLLAVTLRTRLRNVWSFAPAMSELVQNSTVCGIAALVRGAALAGPADQATYVVPDPEHAHVPFPLTELQQAFWIGRTGLFDIGTVGMHLYEEFEVPALDVPRLEQALRRLIARHGMLRMVVLPQGEQQVLSEVADYVVATVDARTLDDEDAEATIAKTRAELSHQVFVADTWPLFDIRATLLPRGGGRLHLSIDGLLADAWATRLLLRDLTRLYRDPGLELPELEISFRDYRLAELALEATPEFEAAERYWTERVPTMALAPDLPLARDPATIEQARFVKVAGRLPREAWERFGTWAARRSITPSAALLAAYATIVATWSKEPRFTLNLPTANRLPLHPQVEEIIGDFTSVTLVEIDVDPEASFEALACTVRGRLAKALDHRLFNGVRVQRELRRSRGDVAAVMPVVFTSVLYGEEPDSAPGEVVYGISQTPQIWLDAQAYEVDGGLALDFDFVDGLFPDGMVPAMHAETMRLLAWLAGEESRWSAPVPSAVPSADLGAVAAYNDTAEQLPRGLLHDPFFALAKQFPERPALITATRTLTYGEVAAQARSVAAHLHVAGAAPNELVAVVMEKGWEQVVAVLGVLAAGAAYLPIDPELPEERIRFLLEYARVHDALVATSEVVEKLRSLAPDCEVRAVPHLVAERPYAAEVATAVVSEDDLAYTIFTSGSTGVPKGVMISHQSARNTIEDINHRYGVGAGDRTLALSSLSFDLSVYDVFGLLSVGGALVIPDAGHQRDPAYWSTSVDAAQVTVWNSVPALMELFVDHLEVTGQRPESVRLVLMSGDWIPVTLPDRVRRVLAPDDLVGLGGATEASIWSILHDVREVPDDWTSVPYGRPMRNQTVHVRDNALRPRPIGVPGHLFIGGSGLALGYLHDESRTRESFVVDPRNGERLYRTGDLGRLLDTDEIEFLGREDFQVKVQGYRVELGEVEAALLQHPDVRAAVVLGSGERQGPKRLVGIVAPRGEAVSLLELEQFLRARLPQYMVPTSFQQVLELPLTTNGKVDRQALELAGTPSEPGAGKALYVAPRTEVEQIVADVFSILLPADRAGVHDNFFELGGDSLLAMRAVVHLRSALSIELPIQVIFDAPTLGDVASLVEEALLGQLEELSEDEVQALLLDRAGTHLPAPREME